MTWFPTFLNYQTALIAAAMAIPALLVLYFLKLRRREVAISSTLLWKKAIQDLQVNAPFQKLRRNLLLLLQMLVLVLLLLALARPVINMTPGAGKVTVLLIDRSASMQARDVDSRSRLEAAKARAKELVGTLGRDGSAAVIAFDDRAEIIHPFSTDAAALRRAIDSIEPTDRPSRLKLAYQLAEAQGTFNEAQLRPNVRPEVWVLSDGKVLDDQELRLTGDVRFEPIGQADTPNIGIVALSARRNYERPTEVQIFARLANYGTEIVEPDVQLSVAVIDPAEPGNLSFAKTRLASTTLLPERWTQQQREASEKAGKPARDSVEFTIELTAAAVIRVEQLRKEGDALAADDVAQVVIPPPRALRVALVTDGNYFLEKAVGALNLKDPVTMLPAQYETRMADGTAGEFDVIIFDRYTPPILAQTQKPLLPEAGNYLWFGALPGGMNLKTVESDGRPVMVEDIGVLDWQRDHPMLRSLQLGRLYVARAMKLQPAPETETLIEGLQGPLLVLHREGRQTHLVAPFDLLQSNWPLRVSFPIFMQNAMQFLALGSEMSARQSYSPGATPVIPRSALQRVLSDTRPTIRLHGPDGSQDITIPATGDFALPALARVGVYTLDPPVPQYEQLAVNLLDPNESNLIPSDHPPGNFGETIESMAGKKRVDLWWWIIACAALPLLLIEWWVYTRRVHL